MYQKDNNVFIKNDDGSYTMRVQYKNIWYNVYIDEDDFEKVSKYHWRSSHKKRKVYIVTGQSRTKTLTYLHNYIMNYTYISGYEIDHIDGNSLNNRKCNLRQGYAEEVRCVHKKLTTIFDTVIEILTKIVYNIRGVA
jgi:hypothetical protein